MFSSTKKTSSSNSGTSAELFERAQKVAPGGVHSPVRAFKSVGGTPIFFERADGATLTSVEGNRYTDFCLSFGPLILGHRDAHVTKAIHEMVDTAWTFGACEPYSLRLAEKIKEFVPFVEKLRFVSSGTEAVMTLARLARAATGRKYLLKFDGCYHGHVDSMLVKAGSGLAGESIGLGASDSAGVSETVAHETLVAPLDDEAAVTKIFANHGHEIAAIFIEPLPANYGLLLQRTEFLQFLRKTATDHGALLIFDEVISGFRTGPAGMAGKTGITPDLVAYGKVLGGGFNVACYAGPAKFMDLMAPAGPVYQAGTLSANPVGMVAGYETLAQIQSTDLYSILGQRTARFAKEINDFCAHSDLRIQVDHYESIFWMRTRTDGSPIRSYRQIPESHPQNYKILFHSLLEQKLYFAPSGFEVGFLSAAHTDEIVDDAIQKICQVLKTHEDLLR